MYVQSMYIFHSERITEQNSEKYNKRRKKYYTNKLQKGTKAGAMFVGGEGDTRNTNSELLDGCLLSASNRLVMKKMNRKVSSSSLNQFHQM
jgi:hypothetical protein